MVSPPSSHLPGPSLPSVDLAERITLGGAGPGEYEIGSQSKVSMGLVAGR